MFTALDAHHPLDLPHSPYKKFLDNFEKALDQSSFFHSHEI
jgi:hypothetical protein